MMQRIDKKRLNTSFPNDIKQASYLIAFNPDKLMFYGSQAKKAMYLSSGDIDLLEPIKPSQAGDLESKIKQIVRNIEKEPLCYLADFKSGVDTFYLVDIGKIQNGKVVGFDKARVKADVSHKDFNNKKDIFKLLGQPMTAKRWFELEDLIRDKQILRWNKDELLKGYKLVRGQKVTLEDSIKQTDAMTKLDTIRYVPSIARFVEITNYFNLVSGHEEFNDIKYVTDLKLNILKCYYQQKYIKLTKRLLTLLLLQKKFKLANKLFGIIHGGVGIMYQCYSELTAILYVLQHHGSKAPADAIRQQLDSIRYRLGNVYEFDFHEKKIDGMIDATVKHPTAAHVEQLADFIYGVCNEKARQLLAKLKFLPLPKQFAIGPARTTGRGLQGGDLKSVLKDIALVLAATSHSWFPYLLSNDNMQADALSDVLPERRTFRGHPPTNTSARELAQQQFADIDGPPVQFFLSILGKYVQRGAVTRSLQRVLPAAVFNKVRSLAEQADAMLS